MRQNSREEILNRALELFSQKGYEAVGPAEIVEKAGVKKPTLYYFFGSKEGLLEELLRINYGKLDARLSAACGCESGDLHKILTNIVNMFFDFAHENKDFYLWILSMSFAPPGSKTAAVSEKYHKKHYEILIEFFSRAAGAEPKLKGREFVASYRFLALINAQIGLWYRGFAKLNEDTAKTIADDFLYGVISNSTFGATTYEVAPAP